MEQCTIRRAVVDDAETILRFICELAEYEDAADEVRTDVDTIRNTVFAHDNCCDALICEIEGLPIGFALWHYTYSTRLGRRGLYLVDLYVSPPARGQGVGSQILRYLAAFASDRGYGRVEWSVLKGNAAAIKTYDATGAMPQNDWIRYRLSDPELEKLAKR